MDASNMTRALCSGVEQAVGRQLRTPKDFDWLSERIYARSGELLSRNTLRRIWGNMQDGTQPRSSTLSILARFLGYADFDAFGRQSLSEGIDASSPVMNRRLAVGAGLVRGDRLRLTWLPDRVCDVVYNGSLHFSVIDSKNTRLKEGDTFLCGLIIEGEPLYIDEWQHGDMPSVAYVCGKKSGVRFERL